MILTSHFVILAVNIFLIIVILNLCAKILIHLPAYFRMVSFLIVPICEKVGEGVTKLSSDECITSIGTIYESVQLFESCDLSHPK